MTGTQEEVMKELKCKRASYKGRLTTFERYILELKQQPVVTKAQLNETKTRLKKIEAIFEEYDLIQISLEIKQENPENENERELTEARFFKCIGEAQELIEKHSGIDADSSSSTLPNNFKLPQIKIPFFNGEISKWLEFHDIFTSMIHNNDSIASINKYQYLKSALSGSAASVIASLEITSNNYDVAWKLLCDRFNDKHKLIHTHLQELFEVSVNESSLRSLVDHISKHLRALGTLGEKTENWDTLIIFLFAAKLDSKTSIKWEEYKSSITEKASLDDLFTFLRRRADVIEATSSSNVHVGQQQSQQQPQLQQYKRINKYQKSFVAASCKDNQNTAKCIVCNEEHLIYYCKRFLGMSPADRLNFIIKQKHCINCLRSGHLAPQCKSRPCKQCNNKHNSLLHFDKQMTENKQLVSSPISLSTCVKNQVLLSTAVVKVSCANSHQYLEARCLLDCGSQSSFISQELKNKLSVQTENVNSVSVTGINSISFEALQRCTIKVQSSTSAFSTMVNAFIIKEITSSLPSHEIDISKINMPKNITLADEGYHIPAKIDMLIGADLFWDILCAEKLKLGQDMPILQNSMFGWLITGPIMCCQNNNSHTTLLCNFSQAIRNQLTKFWELEELPRKPVMSREEEECEQHFVEHTRRLEDGRFCVSLPLKMDPKSLGNSYNMARKRFDSLERRFQRQPDIKTQYVEFLDEYEALGHLSKIERVDNAVFLPHHPILKEASETTKCRVVFDASARTTSGLTLNEIMMVGPTVQDDIFSILIRLRQHAFILTGDIEKMYRQILVEPSQRHLQTILWRKNEREPISHLQLNTVTYGTSSAPFLSTRCLVQLANECDDLFIKDIMLHDYYIDDLITGAPDESILQNVYNSVTKQLESACFNLRKVKSNSKNLLNSLKKETESQNEQDNLKISTASNTLGIEWDPNSDCILIAVAKPCKMYENCNRLTKRMVLSMSSSIFDPLGLLSICIVTCKIILQELWLLKLGWDEQIPDNISQSWQSFFQNIKLLENLSIPRQAICANPISVELHTFSDASLKAFAACLYVRSSDALSHVTVRLLCAKSKVAPLKTLTIPRLELCGAVLAARLCTKVTDALRCTINKKYFWCDSNVVLGWLKTPPHRLSAFVSHRVAEVGELGANCIWMYIPSSLNPADLASRGVRPEEMKDQLLWWDGPTFLSGSQTNWPEQRRGEAQIKLPEIRVHICNIDIPQNSVIDFNKYSSFLKLRRILAYVFRFINNCRKERKTEQLTVEELENSESKLAQLSQQESFPKLKDNWKRLPAVHSLTPIVDEVGLVRVGGRIENSNYTFDKRHPILVNGKHHLTKLIMRYYHAKLMHAGPQLLLSVVRERYWPLGGRVLARQICKHCIICKRLKGVVAKQIMGNLPSQRLSPGFPFEATGTDYAGPFFILNRKGRGARLVKCYLCVFICFKVKAVHLELVSDLTTEAFILALRRFMSRRGKPREIFSDNGSNFVGANREIAALVKNCSTAVSDLVEEGIKFKFSPVYSPHFGGLYEAAVKSAKFHIKRVVGNAHFTFEELATLFCQIEAILNSRPIMPLSTNANDLSPLTPGHFLIGRPLTSLPAPDLQDTNPRRLHRYARIEQARQHIWNRWSREYICELQQRTKWKNRQPDIQPNQLVLIRDESNPPMKWPLGRIVAVYPGSDGACRVADIRTSKGILRRAINKICPLLDSQ